jgi:ribosomal protein S18 acetylase RimI-like enzyme
MAPAMDDERALRIELAPVGGDREPFVPLLLEADELEPVVRSYLDAGELFEIREQGRTVGVCLLVEDGEDVEIKNIAIEGGARGRGLGRQAIVAISELATLRGALRLIVGTADSSDGTIAFYRRVGFHDDGIRPGFFDAYPEPVVEDGRVAHDMVMFAMDLASSRVDRQPPERSSGGW